MSVRLAQAGDADAIAAIWNPIIRETTITFNPQEKTPAQIRDDIAARTAMGQGFFVCDIGGEITGFATYFQFRNGAGYARTAEHTIVLGSGVRGQGHGRALLTAVEDHARMAGYHSMIAGVSAENETGAAFHRRMAYRLIAVVPEVGYKFDRYIDLMLFQKFL